MSFGNQVERVAQVEARDGAPGSLEFIFPSRCRAGCKHERGAVKLVLDSRGHDADHALVKIRIENADGSWCGLAAFKQGFSDGEGLFAHATLDVAPLAVDAVEQFGQFVGSPRIVSHKAFDTDCHVRQPARSIDAWTQREAEVKGRGLSCVPHRSSE